MGDRVIFRGWIFNATLRCPMTLHSSVGTSAAPGTAEVSVSFVSPIKSFINVPRDEVKPRGTLRVEDK